MRLNVNAAALVLAWMTLDAVSLSLMQTTPMSTAAIDTTLSHHRPSLNHNHHHFKKRRQNNNNKIKHHRKIQNRLATTASSTAPFDSTEFVFSTKWPPSSSSSVEQSLNGHEQSNDDDSISLVKLVDMTVKVGDTVILKCEINSSLSSPALNANPGVIWMQGKLGSVLTLNANRITVDTRFEVVRDSSGGGGVDIDSSSSSSSLVSFYHLKIANVQLYDENEYACESSITKNNDDEPRLHSLVRLHVTRKRLSLTSA